MKKHIPTSPEEARQYAIDWQIWASEFEAIAEKFDLVEEFKENAII